MSHSVSVRIHPSQFPENVRRDFLHSLRSREVNHKFHYDSIKQTQKWLRLHEAYSPSRTDADCAAIYDQSFGAAISRIGSAALHLIGLGCGGGQKDTRLIRRAVSERKKVSYTPSDVSVAMVLVAQQTATKILAPECCFPFVCDLLSAENLNEIFENGPAATRLLTFFGMIPNFEPGMILPKLAGLLRRDDWLLFSANLAPGSDYADGVQKILPLYDNELTRDWLQSFLFDLGVEARDGRLQFNVEDNFEFDLKRVVAHFEFQRVCRIELPEENFTFQPGEKIRLFFSYRHTPERVYALLDRHGLKVLQQWIARSGEEGVFLCRKS